MASAIPSATGYEITSLLLPGGEQHLSTWLDVGAVFTTFITDFLLPSASVGTSYQFHVRAYVDNDSDGTREDIGPAGQIDVTLVSALTAPVLTIT